jgi:iron complex outermembrane receptor protein
MVKTDSITIFKNTSNATLRENLLQNLMLGLGFSQNTTNFDVSRKFDKLNVALEQNTEMRISNKTRTA